LTTVEHVSGGISGCDRSPRDNIGVEPALARAGFLKHVTVS